MCGRGGRGADGECVINPYLVAVALEVINLRAVVPSSMLPPHSSTSSL